MPRPMPSAKRPRVRRCIVVPQAAVTSGMAGRRVRDAGGDAHLLAHRSRGARQRRRLLHVEALGQEDRAQPDPLGVPHLVEQRPAGRRRARPGRSRPAPPSAPGFAIPGV